MKFFRYFLLGIVFITINADAQSDGPLRLWYDCPAKVWEEALPLGNGKTGAMVYGRVCMERIALNDNTLWSGFPEAGNNADGPKILLQVRMAIDAGTILSKVPSAGGAVSSI